MLWLCISKATSDLSGMCIEQYYRKTSTLILGFCSDSMMCIFIHVMENPQHKLLSNDPMYKMYITIVCI